MQPSLFICYFAYYPRELLELLLELVGLGIVSDSSSQVLLVTQFKYFWKLLQWFSFVSLNGTNAARKTARRPYTVDCTIN